MESPEDRNAEFARLYGESMREALENLDKVSQEAKKMHEQAIDEIIATKEIRKQIEANADEIAKEVLEKRRKGMEKDIRERVSRDLAVKLLHAGRTRDEIVQWLELPVEEITQMQRNMQNPLSHYVDAVINITQSGRGGIVQFIQGDKTLHFHWEFGGGDTLALIFVPNEKTWEAQTGIPIERRTHTLQWIADQVIHQKAQGSKYRIEGDVIVIY
jgi:hypothetical protein